MQPKIDSRALHWMMMTETPTWASGPDLDQMVAALIAHTDF